MSRKLKALGARYKVGKMVREYIAAHPETPEEFIWPELDALFALEMAK